MAPQEQVQGAEFTLCLLLTAALQILTPAVPQEICMGQSPLLGWYQNPECQAVSPDRKCHCRSGRRKSPDGTESLASFIQSDGHARYGPKITVILGVGSGDSGVFEFQE